MGQWGATPGPAGGEGTGHECHFRAPSSEASGVSPFLHHLEGVQSKLLGRGRPGLSNKYRRPQSRGRAEGKSSANPGPHARLGPSWKDIPWQEGQCWQLHTASWSPEAASDPTEVPGKGPTALLPGRRMAPLLDPSVV